jgi:hypothetical protein
VPAGSTNVPVTSTSGFTVGQKLAIGYGDTIETATVTEVGKRGTQAYLSSAAAAGATTIKVTSTANITAGDTIRLDIGSRIEKVTVASVGTSGSGGTGLTLTAPLKFAHSSNLPFTDRGTGVSFSPATSFAHSSNEPVRPLGSGITLDKPLDSGHGVNAPLVVDGVVDAGYQGSPIPDLWFGGPALAGAGNVVLRDADGRVADSLNYGRLVDPWLAEGYQGASGSGRSGCTAMVPAVTAGAGTSAVRYPDGADTDSNCADFVTSRKPTPGASNVSALDAGPLVSLQLSGSTASFLRHEDGGNDVAISDVTSSSSTALKQDATFVKAAGLADASCVSFESVNRPGSYLRHENFVLHLQADDGSSLFAQDATFCPKPGNSGAGTSYQSVNFPTKYIRAYQGAAYLASNGGSNAWDAAASWADESSWQEATPWAPVP